MAKKMSVAEVRTEYKRKLRKAFKEYPVLYNRNLPRSNHF